MLSFVSFLFTHLTLKSWKEAFTVSATFFLSIVLSLYQVFQYYILWKNENSSQFVSGSIYFMHFQRNLRYPSPCPRKSRETIPLFQPVCWMWNRLMAILIHTRLENGNINPSKGLSNITVSGLPTPRERVLAGKSSLISLLSLCLSVLGLLILVSCGLQGLARNTSSPGKNAVRIEDFPLWLHLI